MADFLELTDNFEKSVSQLNEILQGDENTTVDINGVQKPSVEKKTKDTVNAQVQLVLNAAADIDAVKYSSKSAGLSATSSGQFFSVVSSNGESFLDLYKNEGGVAVYQKTYPSTKKIQSLSNSSDLAIGSVVENNFENLIKDPLLNEPEMYWPATELYSVVEVNSKKCLEMNAVGKASTISMYSELINIEQLKSNGFISASLSIEDLLITTGSAVNGGRILLLQYNANSYNSVYEVKRKEVYLTHFNWTEPKTLKFEAEEIHPDAKYCALWVSIPDGQRIAFCEPLVSAGKNAEFRVSKMSPNLWPSNDYDVFTRNDNGVTELSGTEPVLKLEYPSLATFEIITFACDGLKGGDIIEYSSDIYGSLDGIAEIQFQIMDVDSNIISDMRLSNTETQQWQNRKGFITLPDGSYRFNIRLNLRHDGNFEGYQTAKFKNTTLKTSSKNYSNFLSGFSKAFTVSEKSKIENHTLELDLLNRQNSGHFSQPNLAPDVFFNELDNSPNYEKVIERERACLKLKTGTALSKTIKRSSILGNEFSCGVTCYYKDKEAWSRVLIMQLNSQKAQISSNYPERVTFSFDKSINDESEPLSRSSQGVQIHEDCEYIQIYYEGVADATISYGEPWIRPGVASSFCVPMPEIANYWPDPYWQGNKMGSISADRGGIVEQDSKDPQGSLVLALSVDGLVRRYYVDSVGILSPNSKPYLHGLFSSDIQNGAEIGVLYLDVNNAEIPDTRQIFKNSLNSLSKWQSVDTQLVIPNGCKKVQFRFVLWPVNGSGSAKFKDLILSRYPVTSTSQVFNMVDPTLRDDELNIVYLSPDGDDNNDGSLGSPLKSFSQASKLLGKNGRVYYLDGTYGKEAAVNCSNFNSLEVITTPLSNVVIKMGEEIETDFVLADGSNKIWRTQHIGTAPSIFIYEDDTPEGLIDDSERHPLHRGRKYRLPSHRLWKANSLEHMESSDSPMWFYDFDNDSLYITTTDGAPPSTHSYYIPSGRGVISATNKYCKLSIQGITVKYGMFDFSDLAKYEATDCVVIGSPSDGIRRDSTTGLEYRCEAAGSANDGTNMHNSLFSEPLIPGESVLPASTIVSFDSYSHDNYDDGDSCHERCEGTYIGGLWEYNGDRGIATSYGAHVTVYNGITRQNGVRYRNLTTRTAGEGFATVGSTDVKEGGIGTQMVCISCTSYDDIIGFAASQPDCTTTAINCHTVRSVRGAYNAEYDSSVVNIKNCTDKDSVIVKGAGSGSINVDNGNLVT